MFDNFFLPKNNKEKLLKWVVSILVLFIGSSLFICCIFDIITFEAACNNPVYVNATITVSPEDYLMSTDTYYTSYLSYSYEGKEYSDVFYSSGKSSRRREDDGKIISVALNPNNPAELATDMIHEAHLTVSIVILSAGLALLIYGAAIESDRFLEKRIEHEQKKYRTVMHPDYLKDISLTLIAVMALIQLILFFVFPHTFGLYSIISSL